MWEDGDGILSLLGKRIYRESAININQHGRGQEHERVLVLVHAVAHVNVNAHADSRRRWIETKQGKRNNELLRRKIIFANTNPISIVIRGYAMFQKLFHVHIFQGREEHL